MDYADYVNYIELMRDSPLVEAYNPDMATMAQSRLNALRSDAFFEKYKLMDWQDYMMRNVVNQRYYVSVAGKPKQTSYMFSMGYNDTKGIIKNTGFKNITVRLNMDQEIIWTVLHEGIPPLKAFCEKILANK